jgi:hypothetical protein
VDVGDTPHGCARPRGRPVVLVMIAARLYRRPSHPQTNLKRQGRSMERDGTASRRYSGWMGSWCAPSCSMTPAASGGWRWRPPSTWPGARPVLCGRSAMVGGGWWSATCRWRIGRSCWWGPSACGAAPNRLARCARGPRSPTRDRPPGRAHRASPSRDRPPWGPAEDSVAQTARDFGVSWHTAMAAVRDHGRPRVDHLSRLGAPTALGLDETAFLALRDEAWGGVVGAAVR